MQAEIAHTPQKRFQPRQVETELGLDELGAGLDLLRQPARPFLEGRRERVLHRAQEKSGGGFEGAAAQKPSMVAQSPRRPQQRDRVQVEDRFGLRLIARRRIGGVEFEISHDSCG